MTGRLREVAISRCRQLRSAAAGNCDQPLPAIAISRYW